MIEPSDLEAAIEFLQALVAIPSPTGFHQEVQRHIRHAFDGLGLPGASWSETRKGALALTLPGACDNSPRGVAVHVDTLGAMVRKIKDNGRLMLTQIGGFAWSAVEGENVTVHALSSSARVRGTVQMVHPSVHTSDDVRHGPRDDEGMEVRLDVRCGSAAETRALGIEVGDIVCFDPRFERTETGYIKSRFLDDKAGVAAVFGALVSMRRLGQTPQQRTTVFFSNYEEVGHGAAAGLPMDLHELLVVDMAASTTGEHQNADEYSVGICAKDSGGPYDLRLRQKLVCLARDQGIPFRIDTYPHYGSDGGAFLRAGGEVRVGLIGPGVDASHGYERTHISSLESTIRLVQSYLLSE